MNKHIKGLVCAAVMALTFTQTGGTAFAAQLSPSDLNLSKSEITKLEKEGKLNDQNFIKGILDARKTKTELSKIKELDNELGISKFWSSVTPKELEQYYIHDDGTVTLRDSNVLTSKSVKSGASSETGNSDKAKQIERNLKQYVSVLEKHNKNIGVNRKVLQTDGDGRITNAGDFSGEENYNTDCDLSEAIKGDVLVGDKPGIGIQGQYEHAGIYNGKGYSDNCIFSNDGFGKTARFDSVSGWDKEYNSVYDLNVWTASSDQAIKAYKVAYSTFYGTPYAFGEKYDTDTSYCSKIPWYGYKVGCDIDLDGTDVNDEFVLPISLYSSDNTSVRHHWTD